MTVEQTTAAFNAFTSTAEGHGERDLSETKGESRHTVLSLKNGNGTEPDIELSLAQLIRFFDDFATGLPGVDVALFCSKLADASHKRMTLRDYAKIQIQISSLMVGEHPDYSFFAGRLLALHMEQELQEQGIFLFTESAETSFSLGLMNQRTIERIRQDAKELNLAIDWDTSRRMQYFGAKTLYDRYFLKHPKTRKIIEHAPFFWMRIAVALSSTLEEALELYRIYTRLDFLPSSPTLFNAGTSHEQLSSCYLLDSPQDDLRDIYKRYGDIALLSKFSGGIGLSYSRVRSQGSLIKSTNGHSNGIVPWLKTLDSSVAAVNQGGRRKGAACVYLESWHGDIEDFLELRENTGDDARRTHNLNLAHWLSDLFMSRVESDAEWSLFDPKDVPELVDSFGKEFEDLYTEAERKGLAKKIIPARKLYARMMKTLAETGNGWMCFKDASNSKCNQVTKKSKKVVHLSNLCTEIIEVTDSKETAVCNLGSINLSNHVDDATKTFDFDKLATTVRVAIRQLDRVIDINFYPIPEAATSNSAWRPVGLGLMGLQDVFFKLGLSFDSPEALQLSTHISEEIFYNAVYQSVELAKKNGPFESFHESQAAEGILHSDHWKNVDYRKQERFNALRDQVKTFGMRNSLLIAIAPTATIAGVAGCYECIEPQTSNLFKRETLSGEFLQINHYLVRDLQALGLWDAEMRRAVKEAEGSIAGIDRIPEELRKRYRTSWELPMKALIDLAASRLPFIDQSQSLNLFMEDPHMGRMSSMYMYAWKKGLKTTYYLRSRPKTKIQKTTLAMNNGSGSTSEEITVEKQLACSLENPEACEACQ